jgi:hypothetical protein
MVKPTVRMQNAHFCSHSAPSKRFMILVQTKTKRVDGHVIGDTVHVASKHHLSAFSSSRSLVVAQEEGIPGLATFQFFPTLLWYTSLLDRLYRF